MPTTKSSVRVKVSLPAGLNDKGKQARVYVQQIVSANPHRIASASGQTYDWIVQNAGKPEMSVTAPDKTTVKIPAANFAKLGRTAADESGLFRVKYELGDGVYRIVRPNVDKRDSDGRFTGWPETVFAKVSGGQLVQIDQTAARGAFGLPPATVKVAKTTLLDDDDDDVSI